MSAPLPALPDPVRASVSGRRQRPQVDPTHLPDPSDCGRGQLAEAVGQARELDERRRGLAAELRSRVEARRAVHAEDEQRIADAALAEQPSPQRKLPAHDSELVQLADRLHALEGATVAAVGRVLAVPAQQRVKLAERAARAAAEARADAIASLDGFAGALDRLVRATMLDRFATDPAAGLLPARVYVDLELHRLRGAVDALTTPPPAPAPDRELRLPGETRRRATAAS